MLLRAVMVLCAGSGMAQENAPIGILRGDLLAWTGTARTGELTFRNAENRVYQCSFDGKTYFERANQRIVVAALQAGDRVEIVADRKDGTGLCYARTIHVLDLQPAGLIGGIRPRLRTSIRPTELFAPRGDMTFAGVVLRISPDLLMLRMRTNEHRTIHLRSDTRFLSEGQSLDRSNLEVNTRVFIRAGKNLDDEIEAYQVVWGNILEP
ncbi:MAG: DUF5666 domain-containing protein [Acidobacteriota bacterium]|nr:DUF5666 domain-containing protein [Acidobacteriota bacterium]